MDFEGEMRGAGVTAAATDALPLKARSATSPSRKERARVIVYKDDSRRPLSRPSGNRLYHAFTTHFPLILAQVSRSVTVRLKTSAPGLESVGSLMKYAVRSN